MSDGALGEAPWWFETIEAARHLGVVPWELAQAPIFWQDAALAAMSAEAMATARKADDR